MKLGQMTTFEGPEGVVQSGQELLSIFLSEPVIQAMEFSPEPSDYKLEPTKKGSLSKITRKEGEDASRQRLTGSPNLGEQAIYSYEFAMDRFRKLDENVGVSEDFIKLRAQRQIAKNTRLLAAAFAAHVINGAGNASTNEQMYGLGTLIADAAAGSQTARLGFTAAELADMRYPVQLDLTREDIIDEFLAMLEQEIALVPGANAIYLNRFLKSRINTRARKQGVLTSITNLYKQSVEALFGVPLIVVPDAGIPLTSDTWSGHNNACSLYIVNNSEFDGVDYPTNSGFYYKGFPTTDQDQDNVSGVHVHTNLRLQSDNCVRRLSQIGLQPYENVSLVMDLASLSSSGT